MKTKRWPPTLQIGQLLSNPTWPPTYIPLRTELNVIHGQRITERIRHVLWNATIYNVALIAKKNPAIFKVICIGNLLLNRKPILIRPYNGIMVPETKSCSERVKFHPGQYPGGIPWNWDEDARWKIRIKPKRRLVIWIWLMLKHRLTAIV